MSTQLTLGMRLPARRRCKRVLYRPYEFVYDRQIRAWDVFRLEGRERRLLTSVVSDKSTGRELYDAFMEIERD